MLSSFRPGRFFQSTLDSLSTHIAILDESGTIIAANAAWRDHANPYYLVGVPVDENYLTICESNSPELPENSSELAAGIRAVLACERDDFSIEYVCHDPTQDQWFNVRLMRLRGEEFNCVVMAHENVTENKFLQMHLVQAQKLESVGQLAAGIAHEMNTPLQYVGDNTEYLQKSFARLLGVLEKYEGMLEAAKSGSVTPDLLTEVEATVKKARVKSMLEEIPEAIKDSLDGIQTVARIVRAMKEFSHPGTDEKTKLDINRAIETTISVAKNEWKYVADIETDLDSDLPLVSGFPGELNQVFLNILVNAAHAIADVVGDGANGKGKITFSTRLDGDSAEIRITDTGGGIPEAVRSRIFDPFFTTKELGKGTGQGLAIAHSAIVGKHGGRIWFESKPGEGTTFFIKLPLHDDAEAETSDATSAEIAIS